MLSLERAYLPSLQPEGIRYYLEDDVIGKCPRGSVSPPNFPEVSFHGVGSIPMRSFTADEIRWVQPR